MTVLVTGGGDDTIRPWRVRVGRTVPREAALLSLCLTIAFLPTKRVKSSSRFAGATTSSVAQPPASLATQLVDVLRDCLMLLRTTSSRNM